MSWRSPRTWDFTTVLMIVVIVALLIFLTHDLWLEWFEPILPLRR